MSKHAAYYRGYRIEGEKGRQGWLLRISPEKPELPILQRAEFRTSVKVWPQAVADGVARIDALLQNGQKNAISGTPTRSTITESGRPSRQ